MITTGKQILGYTEEITECGCCGKTNLKGTYVVDFDGNGITYFGSKCIEKVYGVSKRNLDHMMVRLSRKNGGSYLYKKAT